MSWHHDTPSVRALANTNCKKANSVLQHLRHAQWSKWAPTRSSVSLTLSYYYETFSSPGEKRPKLGAGRWSSAARAWCQFTLKQSMKNKFQTRFCAALGTLWISRPSSQTITATDSTPSTSLDPQQFSFPLEWVVGVFIGRQLVPVNNMSAEPWTSPDYSLWDNSQLECVSVCTCFLSHNLVPLAEPQSL